MTYATQQDLVDRFGETELIQLTDRANPPADAIDATVVTRALDDADAEIDAYIGRRYELPLATTPERLTRIACDLARHALYDDGASESVQKRHDDALKALRDIADGRAVLDIAGTEPEAASGDAVQIAAPDRVFGRDSLKDY